MFIWLQELIRSIIFSKQLGRVAPRRKAITVMPVVLNAVDPPISLALMHDVRVSY